MRRSQAIAVATLLVAVVCSAEEKPATYWEYSARFQMNSHIPGEGIESFLSSTNGSASMGGAVTLGCGGIDGRDLNMTFKPVRRGKRFILITEIDREGEDPKRREHNLSDLKPITIDLAVSKTGREYYATVMPSVRKVEIKTKPFSVEDLRVDYWHFQNSPVLVNDSLYVGRLGGGGEIVDLAISDIADIRFSLREEKGWKPWGVLQGGTLSITHPDDGTTIQITGVKHGPSNAPFVLPNGPYHIWVEWDPPSMTSAEVHKQLKRVRQQIISGEILGSDGGVQLIDKQLAREPAPWLYSSGFSGRAVMSR